MLKNFLKTVTLATGLLIPGIAAAAVPAIVTTDLNFRTGPGGGYPAFDVIPEGEDVTVYGCLSGYNWCDISWAGYRGWVAGDYLAYIGQRYYRRPISSIGITIGVPVIGFDRYDYYDRWYDDDYFDRWIRREIREERREDRREWRRERREERREAREERREERRDRRRDRRQDDLEDERIISNDGPESVDRQQRRAERAELREERRDGRAERRERREERGERRKSADDPELIEEKRRFKESLSQRP